MKTPYVKRRDRMIDEIMNNVKTVYPDDKRILSAAVELTVELTIAEPNEEFVDDLWGFMMYCSLSGQKASKALTTVFHDLSEFARNRNEAWFCPRSSGYSKYLTGVSGK